MVSVLRKYSNDRNTDLGYIAHTGNSNTQSNILKIYDNKYQAIINLVIREWTISILQSLTDHFSMYYSFVCCCMILLTFMNCLLKNSHKRKIVPLKKLLLPLEHLRNPCDIRSTRKNNFLNIIFKKSCTTIAMCILCKCWCDFSTMKILPNHTNYTLISLVYETHHWTFSLISVSPSE